MFGNSRAAYDKTAAMWSPDGELVQLLYARKASEKGAAGIGLLLDERHILLAGEYVHLNDPLIESPKKIKYIDDKLYIMASGLSTDSNYLITQAQYMAQQNRLIYGERMSAKALAMKLGDLMARHTLVGGLRPFGTSLLIAGYEFPADVAKLYFVDNGGAYFSTKAYAAGQGSSQIIAYLREHYKMGLSVDDAKKLVLDAMTKATGRAEPLKEEEVEFLVVGPDSP